MPGVKKIDYRELGGEQTPQGETPTAPAQQEQGTVEVEKVSFFSSLATKWGMMDKKTKIELIVLALVIGAIVASLVFYFTNIKPSFNPVEFHAPGAEKSIEEM